ncbi:MAG: CPBP family intramembrane metalloprotease [Candidatus Obscuribacterales bacterium]|nr:CPBP family intramembrane metalloprotease [Candidatus Obscuribacterales bacterium]
MVCCVLGLIAQGCKKQPWLEWVIRVIIGLFLFGEIIGLISNPLFVSGAWNISLLTSLVVVTTALLWKPGRKLISLMLTGLNQIISGRVLLAFAGRIPTDSGKMTAAQAMLAERIFVPESIPHLNGMWLYVTCLVFMLMHTDLNGFKMPAIMIPIPTTMDQLFSYNLLGLVFLAFAGVGILVSRSPKEALVRLGLVKPTWRQILLGIGFIFFTFAYDYVWSMYTHSQEGLGYAEKLSHFNDGSFVAGGAGSALALATATGFCAGIGEELLCRGALQPAFGILPAAFLHGVLHGQFAHAPMLILQVFGWSMFMGILRRYTNTTTTIVAHSGFNFVSTFLFAFNP